VATILTIFQESNKPNFVQFKQQRQIWTKSSPWGAVSN